MKFNPKYLYTMKGTDLLNKKHYTCTSMCNNRLSKREEKEWAMEERFDPKTVSITKTKLKTK